MKRRNNPHGLRHNPQMGMLMLAMANVGQQHQGEMRPNLNIEEISKSFPPDEEVSANEQACEDIACIICLFNKRKIILKPCDHLITCSACTKQLLTTKATCPLCRAQITSAERAQDDELRKRFQPDNNMFGLNNHLNNPTATMASPQIVKVSSSQHLNFHSLGDNNTYQRDHEQDAFMSIEGSVIRDDALKSPKEPNARPGKAIELQQAAAINVGQRDELEEHNLDH